VRALSARPGVPTRGDAGQNVQIKDFLYCWSVAQIYLFMIPVVQNQFCNFVGMTDCEQVCPCKDVEGAGQSRV